MNINRNNCEAFFLDYYEGTLSDAQAGEMFAFLKANPDLREVFESFGGVSLDAEDASVPDFSFLKREPVADLHGQAQQWMVDYVDGTITTEDNIALENYLNEHPEKRAELAAFEKTILRADASETFGDRSSLKKNVAITPENFEHYAVALIEGTISGEERSLLDAFVLVHPEFSEQLDAFRASVQQADESIAFDAKPSLKRTALLVTKDNIEALLVDKLEGQLAAHEEQAVDAFIAAHPEYAGDYELFTKTKLVADASETFDGKEQLKRGAVLVNENNFEHYAISAAEGLLNAGEQEALNAFVASHEKYRNALAQYAATRVQPDLAVVYSDKAGLKRKEKGAVTWFTPAVRYAAAAMIVVLLSIFFWTRYENTDHLQGTVADKTPANSSGQNGAAPQENNQPVVPQVNDAVVDNGDAHSPVNKQPDRIPSQQNGNVAKKEATPAQRGNYLDADFAPARTVASVNVPEANDAVAFSSALYTVLFDDAQKPVRVRTTPADEYISPGQLAMRWMKDKIEGPNPMPNGSHDGVQAFGANGEPKNKNVNGLDLTETAVNRVGQSTANGKIAMQQRKDGTYLRLWGYEVRVLR